MALPPLKAVDGAGVAQWLNAHRVSSTVPTSAVTGQYQPSYSTDGALSTYYATGVDFAPVATPTAYIVFQGSATKTCRIRRIRVYGMATAYGSMKIKLARWSAAGTLGSAVLSSAVTVLEADSDNAAQTAVVKTVGTANYTTEGAETIAEFGNLNFVPLTTAATSSDGVPWTFDAGRGGEQALVVRGTAQYLVIGGDGDALPSGGVIHYSICWTESSED